MRFTIHELHFIMRQLEARIEWIKDNPEDSAEEEGEFKSCFTAFEKLKNIEYNLELDGISTLCVNCGKPKEEHGAYDLCDKNDRNLDYGKKFSTESVKDRTYYDSEGNSSDDDIHSQNKELLDKDYGN